MADVLVNGGFWPDGGKWQDLTDGKDLAGPGDYHLVPDSGKLGRLLRQIDLVRYE